METIKHDILKCALWIFGITVVFGLLGGIRAFICTFAAGILFFPMVVLWRFIYTTFETPVIEEKTKDGKG